jgi:predicted dithiol-disulfide oxidoreductase (DUF899 family)
MALRPIHVTIKKRQGASRFGEPDSAALKGAYHYLDLMSKGRDEDNLKFTQDWVRHHDRYDI